MISFLNYKICRHQIPLYVTKNKKKPRVYYHVHKILPQDPVLSHLNLVNVLTPYLIWSFILSSHLPFCSDFLTNILYAFLSSYICYTTWPCHPSIRQSISIWWKLQIIKFLIIQFSPLSLHFFQLYILTFKQLSLILWFHVCLAITNYWWLKHMSGFHETDYRLHYITQKVANKALSFMKTGPIKVTLKA